jgi:hypothetical protein
MTTQIEVRYYSPSTLDILPFRVDVQGKGQQRDGDPEALMVF